MRNKVALARHSEDGAVLIWVFWLLLAISMITLGALHFSTQHYGIASANLRRAQMRHAAEGAIHHAIYDILHENGPRRHGAKQTFTYSIGGFAVSVASSSEAGKISLNAADEALLSAAFAANGVAEDDAVKLAAAIIDWRDEDELPSLGGAEAAHYNTLSSTPRNAAFETVGELRRVKGMADNLYFQLREIFSVYSVSAQVDLSAADNKVRRIYEWAQQRRWQGREWQSETDGKSILNPFSSSTTNVQHFIAIVTVQTEQRLLLEAYVRLTGNITRPYDILAMQEVF